MSIFMKLWGVGTASVMLVTGTISANTNIGRDDDTTTSLSNIFVLHSGVLP